MVFSFVGFILNHVQKCQILDFWKKNWGTTGKRKTHDFPLLLLVINVGVGY